MSISLGIYDLFSYLIPGLFYLYVINHFFAILKWNSIDIATWLQPNKAPDVAFLLPIFLAAFIVGYLFDAFSYRFFGIIYRYQKRQKISEKSLASIRRKHPDVNIEFNSGDWGTLFVFIRIRDLELSKVIDKFNADSIMLRNIAFGLFLFSLVNIVNLFYVWEWKFLVFAIVLFFSFLVTNTKSNELRGRFFKQIFRASLAYGKSVKEVIEYKSNSENNKETKETA